MSRDLVCFDRARFESLVQAIENMAVGELWKEIPLSQDRDELDALAHGVNVLSSELRYRLSELQSAQASLIQSGKLAALGEVSSGLAHELNNPLTIVAGYVELVRGWMESSQDSGMAEQAALLRKAERNLERMAAIIRHIMEFARESKPVKTPVLLSEVVEKSLILISEQMRLKNIQIAMNLQADLMAEVSASKLEQVFINLFGNARDAIILAHGDLGGRIGVTSRAVSRSEIEIEICDNGSGMDEETRSRIFQPFFSTKDAGKGMGLGLSISHGIVLEHGGTITCRSEPGRGATFTICLPRFIPGDEEQA